MLRTVDKCERGYGGIRHEIELVGGGRLVWNQTSGCREYDGCFECAEGRRREIAERVLLAWDRKLGSGVKALLATMKFRSRDRRESWVQWARRVRFDWGGRVGLDVLDGSLIEWPEIEGDSGAQGSAVYRFLRVMYERARGIRGEDGAMVPARQRRCRCAGPKRQNPDLPECDCRCLCPRFCVPENRESAGWVLGGEWRGPCGCRFCGYANNLVTRLRAKMPARLWLAYLSELKRRLMQNLRQRWAVPTVVLTSDGGEKLEYRGRDDVIYFGSTEFTRQGVPHIHIALSLTGKVDVDDPASLAAFTEWVKGQWVRLVPDTTFAQGFDVRPPKDRVDAIEYCVKYVVKDARVPRAFRELKHRRLWFRSTQWDFPVKAMLGTWTTNDGERINPVAWRRRYGRRYYYRMKRAGELGVEESKRLVDLGREGVDEPTFREGELLSVEADALDEKWEFRGLVDDGQRLVCLAAWDDYRRLRVERQIVSGFVHRSQLTGEGEAPECAAVERKAFWADDGITEWSLIA